MIRSTGKWVTRLVLGLVLAGMMGWSILAVAFAPVQAAWVSGTLATVVAALALAAVVFLRPWRKAVLALVAIFVAVLVSWLAIPPRNDRDWYPDVAVLPHATIDGSRIILHNIRNCDYRTETDYTVRHYNRTVDLERLRTVDLFLCYWGSRAIAHTIMSFGFESLDPARKTGFIAISIETRKRKGQEYSALRGFFKQYEITYIVGDERDLVRLRTNFRGEDVYLYRFRVEPDVVRKVFLSYVRELNRLSEEPEWYNALTHNCTTSIRGHTHPYAARSGWDWRILLNGYVDELAYETGSLDTSLPFEELRKRSYISSKARESGKEAGNADFSSRIRKDLLDPRKP